MDLQIYIDTSDIELERLEDITPLIVQSISEWVGNKKQVVSLSSGVESDAEDQGDIFDKKLGIQFSVSSKFKLKDPLNFLYSLAKAHKCECAIAILDSESGDTEEVCFFGFEEGRPDLYEIANYLSL